LDELGIRDHQIPSLESEETSDTDADKVMARMRIPFRIIEFIFLLLVSAIPAIFLNLPVGLIARYWALHRREKALRASKVKVKGMDVMLSEKVLLCIVLVPSLWIFYAILLIKFTDWDISTISVALWSFPVFSYMGIVTTEAGMISFKDLKPHIMRLYPSTRRRMLALPAVRRALQEDLRNFIRKIGPSLGDVYTEKTFDWTDFQHTTLSKEKLK
jgi:glycerol-3-phosphate O-acyltransferase / dihydroxyacetone phosphate acyltransferase